MDYLKTRDALQEELKRVSFHNRSLKYFQYTVFGLSAVVGVPAILTTAYSTFERENLNPSVVQLDKGLENNMDAETGFENLCSEARRHSNEQRNSAKKELLSEIGFRGILASFLFFGFGYALRPSRRYFNETFSKTKEKSEQIDKEINERLELYEKRDHLNLPIMTKESLAERRKRVLEHKF